MLLMQKRKELKRRNSFLFSTDMPKKRKLHLSVAGKQGGSLNLMYSAKRKKLPFTEMGYSEGVWIKKQGERKISVVICSIREWELKFKSQAPNSKSQIQRICRPWDLGLGT